MSDFPDALAQYKKFKSMGGAFILARNGGTWDLQVHPKVMIARIKPVAMRSTGQVIAGKWSFEGGTTNFEITFKKGKLTLNDDVRRRIKNGLQLPTQPQITEASDLEVEPDGTEDGDSSVAPSRPTVAGVSESDFAGIDSLTDMLSEKRSSSSDGLDGLDLDGLDGLGDLDLLDAPPPLLVERGGVKKLQQEWDRIDELAGPLPDGVPHPDDGLAPVLRTSKMFDVGDGVSAPLNWEDVSTGELAVAKERLQFERKATAWMRDSLTARVGDRTGRAKESVESNCDMASGLAGLLESHPELIEKGGLLARIVGPVVGQGQHGSDDSAEDVATKIKEASERLKSGGGEGPDGNLVLQFIGCFADGLTEVTEGQETAKKQLDAIWPDFCGVFGVADEDQETFKAALLKRVENFKAIAGGRSDTMAGKGARKGDTRKGINPDDPRLRLTEHDVLIKGDVSGSVHSCFLAYELAETLEDPSSLDEERDVTLTDSKLVDGRVFDALSMTAGGKKAPGRIDKEQDPDLVFHTAYEMLNGLRGMTGAPALTQDQATKVMEGLWRGKGYTRTMQAMFPKHRFSWMPAE